ncbi:hypothetical protein CERSUDRAFT_111609 [Gelatoporia subvermispora B]|uniref:MYND-type domain-containing protein n=1 Tax=Ceriporiopsis subvermispora (strain B) TaxID=914234 RepID=M2PW59_CERS8|nr:hypothetical protein CERSUDRAFT_111609 [Gelatoporia subvermispora B]
MNRRMGWEAIAGVGGGAISREAQKNLEKGEELCRKRKPDKALPYLMKAMEGGNNLDACVQLAFLMPNVDMSIDLLRNAEAKGRENLLRIFGPRCFDDSGDHVGHFWGILETRPYMRVLQAKVRIYIEAKQFANAAETIIEMLRLCPGDNLGQRDSLGSVLLKAGRPADALSFIQTWLQPETMRTGEPPERGGCVFKIPFKTPLSPERAEALGEYCKADMAYSGALAAYKLWGDCELARQYLRVGARQNSYVLVKVLAKVEQPRNLNNTPRQQNGPEDAHDYLWLAQDLWMAPDVWAWADGDAEAKAFTLRICCRKSCGKREDKPALFKRCGGCKEAIYCSQACQKLDWPAHRRGCKESQQMKEIQRAMWLGKPLPKTDIPVVSAEFTPNGIVSTFYD